MLNNQSIKIECEPYLIRFLEKLYGPSPIDFPPKSNFLMFLDIFLSEPPANYLESIPDDKCLEVRLPNIEKTKLQGFNYLSPLARRIFLKEVNKFFKTSFRNEIIKYITIGLSKKDSIDMFLYEFNLPEDSRDRLLREYVNHIRNTRKKKKLKIKGWDIKVGNENKC